MSLDQVVRRNLPQFLAALIVVAIISSSVLAHFYIGAAREDVTGPFALLDHLFDVVLSVAISLLVLSMGHALCARFGISFDNDAEALSFSFFLGTGVLGFFVLVLGLFGQLRPLPILVMIALSLALVSTRVPELIRLLNNTFRSISSSRQGRIASLLMILLLCMLVLRAATPPHVADELIYHLPVPKQFVERGRIFASFDNSLGNVPFLIHMIYALCLMAGSDIAARLLSLFLALATATLIYGFCARYLTRKVALVAFFAFFAAGMVVELAVTTRIDVSLAGMLFGATYALINYLTTEHRSWLWASAVFAGFSLSIKHTAGLWLIFIGFMYLSEMLSRKKSLLKTLRLGIYYSLIALSVAAPWYVKNAVWFHNPIYPFATGEVADFGSGGIRYFNSEDERKLDAHFVRASAEIPQIVREQEKDLKEKADSRLSRHPWRLWEFFTQPYTYLMFEAYQFPNYLFLLTPLIILVKRHKWVTWLVVLSLAFVFSVVLTSWISRYLVPAYPPLTIAAAYILVNLSHQLESKISFSRKLPAYVLIIAFSTVLPTSIASILHSNSLKFLSGLASREEFLSALPDYRPIQFINSQLSPSAHVLTIGAQMCYGLHVPYESDESWFATKWRRLLVRNDSLEKVNADLKQHGFTHILYNPTLFRFAAWMGTEGTGGMNLMSRRAESKTDQKSELGPEYVLLRNWATFTLYEEQFLDQVYSDENGYQIFRIK